MEEPGDVSGFGQSMIAVLDVCDIDVIAFIGLGDLQGMPPGNVRVGHALQDPEGASQLQWLTQKQVISALFDQLHCDDVWLVTVFRRLKVDAVAEKRFSNAFIELRPHQILGEIGRGRDAEKSRDTRGSCQGREQHDPSAHARAHNNLRTFGDLVENRDGVVLPSTDRAVPELARGRTVPEVVEPHERPPHFPTVRIEGDSLGAGHVGIETAAKDDAGRLAGMAVIGDCGAVGPG